MVKYFERTHCASSGNETKFDRNITTNESTHAILIHHLARGVSYRIQIAAYNRIKGEGVKSSPLIIGKFTTEVVDSGLARGGRRPLWGGGVPTYYLTNFSRKLHGNEKKFGSWGPSPPPESATDLNSPFSEAQ